MHCYKNRFEIKDQSHICSNGNQEGTGEPTWTQLVIVNPINDEQVTSNRKRSPLILAALIFILGIILFLIYLILRGNGIDLFALNDSDSDSDTGCNTWLVYDYYYEYTAN